ncbi:MAG: SDR family NAD(P)-dependent oxidoreductase [Actinomycetota bacterium]
MSSDHTGSRPVVAMASGPDDLPDLSGTTAVVTGANSGIGFETALALASYGASVTLACRNVPAAERAADRIRSSHKGVHLPGIQVRSADPRDGSDGSAPGVDVRVAELDLSSLSSVRSFADAWRGPLDLLVNNAGVMAPRTWKGTPDGFELQFGTNHIGHFALTGLLLSALQLAGLPRVVTVSSIAHHNGRADVLDRNPPQGYRPERAYGNSKLANVLFGAELQRRATAHGSALKSTMAHPGVSATGLAVDREGMGANPVVRVMAPWVMKAVFQSAAAGARPVLYAATAAAGGSYTGPRWLKESRGPVGAARLSILAQDPTLASRLWQVSQDLSGVEYHW